MTEHEHQASEIIVGMLFTALAVMFLGSPCNRMGKFEGLKGHKAKDCRDILYFCRVRNLAQMPDGKNIETSWAALGYVFL